MKNIFFLVLAVFLFQQVIMAQIPVNGYSFQASFRDAEGRPSPGKQVALRFTIWRGDQLVYSEEQQATTDQFGLVFLTIGSADGSGQLAKVDWSLGGYNLQVDCDADNNGGYEMLSQNPLLPGFNGVKDLTVSAPLEGRGSSEDPIRLGQQGAKVGQVIKWNGQNWRVANDSVATLVAGEGIRIEGNKIINTGDINGADDLDFDINYAGDVTGKYNNLQIVENAVSTPEIANGAVTGLKINQDGATEGQALIWKQGSGWKPASVSASGTYSAGTGININNNVIGNTGDINPDDDVLKTTAHGGDLSGVYNNLQIAPNVVGTDELKNEAVTMGKIAQSGATTGQVLQWAGNQGWKPTTPSAGSSYSAGTGIAISNNNAISNTGDTDAGDDLTKSTAFSGDVSGTYNNLQIGTNAVGSAEIANGAVGTSDMEDGSVTGPKISQAGATTGQVLQWSGNQGWKPATVQGSNYTAGTGIAISNGNVISNTGLLSGSSAGGDLAGTYPNPTVDGLLGFSIPTPSGTGKKALTYYPPGEFSSSGMGWNNIGILDDIFYSGISNINCNYNFSPSSNNFRDLGSSSFFWRQTYTSQISMGSGLSHNKLKLYESGASNYSLGVVPGQFCFNLGNPQARYAFLNAPGGSEVFTIQGDGTVKVNGTTVHSSDRNRKEEIVPLNYQHILELIQGIPIMEWQYKGQTVRHIGPMAQDFYAAFGLGTDERSIAAVDADGIALAGIKALMNEIEALKIKISALEHGGSK